MAGEIRRGRASIKEAQEAAKNRGSGNFRPFIPNIFWKEDGESRYVLFLNDIESIPQFDIIKFIETESGFESVVAKTDPYFDEGKDGFVDQWDAPVQTLQLAIAVELEPLIETVNGRKRPKGFEVKTVEFERRIRDDDGELTDETEEVVAPAIGIIMQSPNNFFNVIESYDATDAPIDEAAVRITRVGADRNTTYRVDGFAEQDIDLTNLVEYWSGISYIQDEADEISEQLDGAEPLEAAKVLGSILLEKRLEELLDPERYDELLAGQKESMDKFGKKKKSKKSDSKKAAAKARPSQRRTAKKEEPEEVNETPEAEEPEVEEKTTREAPAQTRLAELRKRAAAKKSK